jgi:uncharacterized membrane protein
MRYSILKAFIPSLIGKFFMILIIAYGARFSVQYINSLFGQEGTLMSALISMILAIVVTVTIVLVMLKLDWEKHLEKYLERQDKNKA